MDDAVNLESEHLEVLAEVGFSGHVGGLEATKELATACHISEGDRVLDVGTGTGQTPKFLAANLDCRVVGLDVSPKMVASARADVTASESARRPQFVVGDGTQLPFETGCFDAVIGESVLAFVDEKSGALREFKRVVKDGGYVGLNEVTWTGNRPAADVDPLLELTEAEFETAEGWERHFERAGFTDAFADVHRTDVVSLFVNEFRRHGGTEMAQAGVQFAENLATDEEFREFLRALLASRDEVLSAFERLGYGIYVGQKPRTT